MYQYVGMYCVYRTLCTVLFVLSCTYISFVLIRAIRWTSCQNTFLFTPWQHGASRRAGGARLPPVLTPSSTHLRATRRPRPIPHYGAASCVSPCLHTWLRLPGLPNWEGRSHPPSAGSLWLAAPSRLHAPGRHRGRHLGGRGGGAPPPLCRRPPPPDRYAPCGRGRLSPAPHRRQLPRLCGRHRRLPRRLPAAAAALAVHVRVVAGRHARLVCRAMGL